MGKRKKQEEKAGGEGVGSTREISLINILGHTYLLNERHRHTTSSYRHTSTLYRYTKVSQLFQVVKFEPLLVGFPYPIDTRVHCFLIRDLATLCYRNTPRALIGAVVYCLRTVPILYMDVGLTCAAGALGKYAMYYEIRYPQSPKCLRHLVQPMLMILASMILCLGSLHKPSTGIVSYYGN